jgi:hypothetical protein
MPYSFYMYVRNVGMNLILSIHAVAAGILTLNTLGTKCIIKNDLGIGNKHKNRKRAKCQ